MRKKIDSGNFLYFTYIDDNLTNVEFRPLAGFLGIRTVNNRRNKLPSMKHYNKQFDKVEIKP